MSQPEDGLIVLASIEERAYLRFSLHTFASLEFDQGSSHREPPTDGRHAVVIVGHGFGRARNQSVPHEYRRRDVGSSSPAAPSSADRDDPGNSPWRVDGGLTQGLQPGRCLRQHRRTCSPSCLTLDAPPISVINEIDDDQPGSGRLGVHRDDEGGGVPGRP